jgi:hypothetical protein
MGYVFTPQVDQIKVIFVCHVVMAEAEDSADIITVARKSVRADLGNLSTPARYHHMHI